MNENNETSFALVSVELAEKARDEINEHLSAIRKIVEKTPGAHAMFNSALMTAEDKVLGTSCIMINEPTKHAVLSCLEALSNGDAKLPVSPEVAAGLATWAMKAAVHAAAKGISETSHKQDGKIAGRITELLLELSPMDAMGYMVLMRGGKGIASNKDVVKLCLDKLMEKDDA